jgi:N-acetyl-D-muramate 6-phosphate phosphatase
MLHPIRAVLFDLDGTLIDSAPDLGAAADKIRTDRGLPGLPLEQYRPMAGAGARGMIEVAFGLRPNDEGFESLRQEFLANYQAGLLDRTYAFEGVPHMLDGLGQARILWGVVTNKHERFTRPIAQGMPLLHGARTVVSGDTTPHAKPHPAPLLEAARQLGLDARECLYVGDDERDIVAGRAAGMTTVAATWGYIGAVPWQNWNADVVAHHPHDILRLLSLA